MTGPQPGRDYPPPTPASVRAAQWTIDAIKSVVICAVTWLAFTSLAEAIVS